MSAKDPKHQAAILDARGRRWRGPAKGKPPRRRGGVEERALRLVRGLAQAIQSMMERDDQSPEEQ
jgi:hypothetical protein